MAKIVEQVVQQLHPEAAYFLPTDDGHRSMVLVFDMTDPSQIPAIAEPLFMGGRARVTLTPCMNLDDLQGGLSQLPPDLTSTGV